MEPHSSCRKVEATERIISSQVNQIHPCQSHDPFTLFQGQGPSTFYGLTSNSLCHHLLWLPTSFICRVIIWETVFQVLCLALGILLCCKFGSYRQRTSSTELYIPIQMWEHTQGRKATSESQEGFATGYSGRIGAGGGEVAVARKRTLKVQRTWVWPQAQWVRMSHSWQLSIPGLGLSKSWVLNWAGYALWGITCHGEFPWHQQ